MDIKNLKQKKLKENLRKKQSDMARVFVDENNPSIYRDTQKCIKCGRCKEICEKTTGLSEFYGVNKEGAPNVCVNCGQCTIACGANAPFEKESYSRDRKSTRLNSSHS